MAIKEDQLAAMDDARRVLSPDGTVVGEVPSLSPDQMREIYRLMVLLRTFDQRCLNLQRQGRMGTFAPLSGQEASQVGSAYPLLPQDWIFPTYRDHGAMRVRGVPHVNILRYYMGDEQGNRAPEGVNVFPISIPIATQLVHAVGLGMAANIKGDPVVAVGYAGDGGTSPGDFHEALNFASVFNSPAILFIQNNRYAISVPITRQMRSKTIAQRAAAYNLPGIRVDGQDVLAVYGAMKEASDRARSGGGPTLIEALTYRYGPHTTSDDPKRYRTQDEVDEWQQGRDPIIRFYRYLVAQKLWDESQEAALWEAAKEEVGQSVATAEAVGRPKPEEIFDHIFAEPTWNLKQQKEKLLAELAKRAEGGKHHG